MIMTSCIATAVVVRVAVIRLINKDEKVGEDWKYIFSLRFIMSARPATVAMIFSIGIRIILKCLILIG